MKKIATADKILKAAREVFLKKGFEGASINDIADLADINKSLIYHYFESKENLWRTVKEHILQHYAGKQLEEIVFPMDSFRHFLQAFVTFRYELYRKNPDIARLIAWQRLEQKQDQIAGVKSFSKGDSVEYIRHFQTLGEVRPHLDPQMVDYMIMTSSSMPFMDEPSFLKSKGNSKRYQDYLDMLIDSLYTAFATPKPPQKWVISG